MLSTFKKIYFCNNGGKSNEEHNDGKEEYSMEEGFGTVLCDAYGDFSYGLWRKRSGKVRDRKDRGFYGVSEGRRKGG